MVRIAVTPEVIAATELVTGLIPEEVVLVKGSVAITDAGTSFLRGFANLLARLASLALPAGALTTLREDYFPAFERLNSYPVDGKCLARVEGGFCMTKVNAARGKLESKRCSMHADSDLVGSVLHLPESHPAALSPCLACSGAFKAGSDVITCCTCEQQFHPD